ncbi:hypothetical protein LWP59_18365 [Amycolatopsis acidiphila]|uniref:hypothetical protein n=1 Tax=Amycolatopsis acidiphila TaxID=715473 RepID=UPI001643BDC5|nr:hypothetical protein [Amycolatopsis acidiphila]UIJ63453.1 hypothetical protein LWP59_18365 [Amycolatopsis acidiphila]
MPVVTAAVSEGTRRVYSSYWNRLDQAWGYRRLRHQAARRTHRGQRGPGGRSVGEHLIAALHCLYRHAEDDVTIRPRRGGGEQASLHRIPGAVPGHPATPIQIDRELGELQLPLGGLLGPGR